MKFKSEIEFYEYKYIFRGANGPSLIINTLESFCDIKDLNILMVNDGSLESFPNKSVSHDTILNEKKSDLLCNIVLFPQSFFYPYNYRHGDYKKIFEKNGELEISRLINSYSIHFYGKFSSIINVGINDKSLYEFLALTQCKNVYKRVKSDMTYFGDWF